jgi:hypothetical protein
MVIGHINRYKRVTECTLNDDEIFLTVGVSNALTDSARIGAIQSVGVLVSADSVADAVEAGSLTDASSVAGSK